MTYIGQIELTKKKPPKVDNDNRAWSDLYDTLNHLIDSVNSKSTTEQRRPGDLHNSIGDLKVFKDKTDNKYYMETMTEDGSARREMFISDKDSRSGDDFYSLAGKKSGGGGLSGSKDSRNIEQQLFEQIPWTGGIPNNIAIDADGKLVTDTVAGATVSNNYIVQADLVGSDKTWTVKPNNTTIDSDGKIVEDNVAGAIVTNNKIVAADVVGSGKTFTTKPPVTFRQASIPTALTAGDLWYDTDDGNKLYRADAAGADQITSGEWIATVDATIAIAQADADTADGKAVAAQSTADTADGKAVAAQSTADSKSKTFYQTSAPSSGMSTNDVWYDTDGGNKRYVYTGGNWVAAADTTYDQATAITAAQNTANGKTQSFYDTSAPTAITVGDVWFKTDSNMAMYRASATGSSNWVSTTPDFDVNTTTIIGNTVTTGFVNALEINAKTVAASWVYAGTLTAGQVNAVGISASSISTGTMTAGAINMASGKAQINADGSAEFQNVTVQSGGYFDIQSGGDAYFSSNRIKCHKTGSLSIVGREDGTAGIIFYPGTNSPAEGSHTGDYWSLFQGSGGDFGVSRTGSTKFKFKTDGQIQMASDKYLYLGQGASADTGFRRDGGTLRFYAGAATTVKMSLESDGDVVMTGSLSGVSNLTCTQINTGIGWTECYLQDQNLREADTVYYRRIGYKHGSASNPWIEKKENSHATYYSGDAFMPNVNDSYDLGAGGSGAWLRRWDDIYATNATINTSDEREKEDIVDSSLGLEFIDSLRPISYKWKEKNRIHYGLTAQQVKEVMDSLGISSNDFAGYVDGSMRDWGEEGDDHTGAPLGLRYQEFIAPMIKAIQELKAEVETLKNNA